MYAELWPGGIGGGVIGASWTALFLARGLAVTARVIAARARGRSPATSLRYRDRGTLATISRFQAIGQIRGLQLSGFVGWVVWLAVHLFVLTGFKNRISTLFKWTIAFVGTGRPERTITERQVFARLGADAPTRAGRDRREADPAVPASSAVSEPRRPSFSAAPSQHPATLGDHPR